MESKIKSKKCDKLKIQKNRILKILSIFVFTLLLFSSQSIVAHCDSYDGPVIKEAIKALETNNVNLVLKWISENQEEEIITLFNKTYKLKNGDREIYAIVEKHFFETLVRLHRETEGAAYTGLKQAGNVSKIVQMADESILTGNIEDLSSKFLSHIKRVVEEKYEILMKLSKVKNDSVKEGRDFVTAYVDYVHTIEGIHNIIEHKAEGECNHQ